MVQTTNLNWFIHKVDLHPRSSGLCQGPPPPMGGMPGMMPPMMPGMMPPGVGKPDLPGMMPPMHH